MAWTYELTFIHSTATLRGLNGRAFGVRCARHEVGPGKSGNNPPREGQHSFLGEYSDLDVIANGYRADVREIKDDMLKSQRHQESKR